ncbi:UNVERIFIED_CONTAM: hypothetical protein Scaly_2179300 [Sesamum calycinum]|uniref:Uncharacterized protein n=1 Tax=Sesamum calycinum TaxID=2727403 RepID=A0AAW2MP86_9LAMI
MEIKVLSASSIKDWMTRFGKIANESKAKDAWDILKNYTVEVDRVKKIILLEFSVVVNQMKRLVETLTDVRVGEKILHSLNVKFNHVVVVIEEAKNIESIRRRGQARGRDQGRWHGLGRGRGQRRIEGRDQGKDE